MLCNKCGKNYATTHIKTVINGVVNEQYLCSECAAKEKNSSFDFNNLISSLFYGNPAELQEKCCNICGSTFNDIINSGKAGCSNCYDIFKEEFEPYIKSIHGHTKHIPAENYLKYVKTNNEEKTENKENIKEQNNKINNENNENNKNNKIEALEKELKQAVKEERYEDAAKLRDEINAEKNSN